MILSKIKLLLQYRDEGKIPQEHKHEVNPGLDLGSRENYLYFTLPVALNFQRSSTSMWSSALNTWNDNETHYLFYPEKVISQSFEKVQTDLIKHKLALQKNKHTQIWIKLCETLHDKRGNDPRRLISNKRSCVTQIRNELIEHKRDYPYLNGPKMSDYWMFILSHYSDIKLQNKHKLSIIPDTHIQQASIKLGLTNEKDSPEIVKEKWFEILKSTGIHPVDLHSMLRNWSRNGFNPEV